MLEGVIHLEKRKSRHHPDVVDASAPRHALLQIPRKGEPLLDVRIRIDVLQHLLGVDRLIGLFRRSYGRSGAQCGCLSECAERWLSRRIEEHEPRLRECVEALQPLAAPVRQQHALANSDQHIDADMAQPDEDRRLHETKLLGERR